MALNLSEKAPSPLGPTHPSEIWEEGHSTGGASDGWQNDLLGRPDAQRCGRASFSEATENTIKSSVFGKEQKFYQSYPKNKLLILLL